MEIAKNDRDKNVVRLYIYEIDKAYICHNEPELLGRLPEWRRIKAEGYASKDVKAVSIAAGLLYVRAMLECSMIYGNPDPSLTEDIIYGSQGKAELPGNIGMHFNISHSANVVAVAVFTSPVGLDVEFKTDKGGRVTERMFTEREIAYIGSSEANDFDKRFRDIWTMKEAYLKFTGEGITVPLKSFYMDSSGRIVRDSIPKDAYVRTIRYGRDEECSISICTDIPNFSLDIIPVDRL